LKSDLGPDVTPASLPIEMQAREEKEKEKRRGEKEKEEGKKGMRFRLFFFRFPPFFFSR
jgi:ribosomal protein L12E/L44/L45/RPP1/RPP2